MGGHAAQRALAMSVIARLLIAFGVCPSLGAMLGHDVGRRVAAASDIAAGDAARWEMTALLVGAGAGLLFALLASICVVRRGPAGRYRVADPVVLSLGTLAALMLLGRRVGLDEATRAVLSAASLVIWIVGFLLVTAVALFGRRPARAATREQPFEAGDEVDVTPYRRESAWRDSDDR